MLCSIVCGPWSSERGEADSTERVLFFATRRVFRLDSWPRLPLSPLLPALPLTMCLGARANGAKHLGGEVLAGARAGPSSPAGAVWLRESGGGCSRPAL